MKKSISSFIVLFLGITTMPINVLADDFMDYMKTPYKVNTNIDCSIESNRILFNCAKGETPITCIKNKKITKNDLDTIYDCFKLNYNLSKRMAKARQGFSSADDISSFVNADDDFVTPEIDEIPPEAQTNSSASSDHLEGEYDPDNLSGGELNEVSAVATNPNRRSNVAKLKIDGPDLGAKPEIKINTPQPTEAQSESACKVSKEADFIANKCVCKDKTTVWSPTDLKCVKKSGECKDSYGKGVGTYGEDGKCKLTKCEDSNYTLNAQKNKCELKTTADNRDRRNQNKTNKQFDKDLKSIISAFNGVVKAKKEEQCKQQQSGNV